MMSIHTVAAGGGSILHFDGSRYRVGPDSAGADPGPASYRRGGPLTVTDANVMLGRVQPGSLSPPCSARTATSRWTPRWCAPRSHELADRDRAGHRHQRRRGGGRRLPGHRRGEHGQRDQEDLGAARPRRHPLRPRHVRRCGRPARLRGRRRARHDHGARSTRSPVCCPRTAWVWPTRPRCARQAVEAELSTTVRPGWTGGRRPGRRRAGRTAAEGLPRRTGPVRVHACAGRSCATGTDAALPVPLADTPA